jgi:hypothetical protein
MSNINDLAALHQQMRASRRAAAPPPPVQSAFIPGRKTISGRGLFGQLQTDSAPAGAPAAVAAPTASVTPSRDYLQFSLYGRNEA